MKHFSFLARLWLVIRTRVHSTSFFLTFARAQIFKLKVAQWNCTLKTGVWQLFLSQFRLPISLWLLFCAFPLLFKTRVGNFVFLIVSGFAASKNYLLETLCLVVQMLKGQTFGAIWIWNSWKSNFHRYSAVYVRCPKTSLSPTGFSP